MNTNLVQDAEQFLERIRERSGLFVRCVGNEYGFYHQTFQEYFAARYIIRNINHRRARSFVVRDLVTKGSYPDKTWWEPFLLAVAYLSRKDRSITNRIMRELLKVFHTADDKSKMYIISLAEQCLHEVIPYSIEKALIKEITTLIEQTREDSK